MVDGYDVVVVGGGSAGSALAGRLVAQQSRRVVLLEAGPAWRAEEMPEAVHALDPAPVGSRGVARHPEVHWQDVPARRTPLQEPYHYPRGRGLGGTSNVNAQMAIRPPLEDFERWEQCSPIWGRDHVLDAFVRLETDLDFGGAAYHGDSGPVPVGRLPEWGWGSLARQLAEAATGLGHTWCPDHNAPGTTGVSPQALNRAGGRRVTTNDGYLEPVRDRDNLSVVGDALVDQVLFGDPGHAIGVRYLQRGRVHEVYGDEVVLAAGAIGSPTILMRSGIGRPDRLAAAGVPVRLPLPVGTGLQDHPMINVHLPLDHHVEPPPLAHQCPVVVRFQPERGCPNDAFIYPMTFTTGDTPPGLSVKLTTSIASGSLWITSPDPGAPAVIEQNLLGTEADLCLMRDAVRHLLTVLRHRVWGGNGVRAVAARSGTPAVEIGEADDRSLNAFLLREVTAGFHLSATCPMGEASDEGAVVDGEGRVRGTSGLRVADLSICPTIVRANTHLTAVMVAERLSDLV